MHGLIINQWTDGRMDAVRVFARGGLIRGAAMLALQHNSFINIFMDTAGERNIQLDSYYKGRERGRRIRHLSLGPSLS